MCWNVGPLVERRVRDNTHGKRGSNVDSSQERKIGRKWVTPREEEEFPDKHYDFGEQVERKFKLKPRQRATHTCLVHFTRDLSFDPHLSDNIPLPRH